jgi:hypothetical protein
MSMMSIRRFFGREALWIVLFVGWAVCLQGCSRMRDVHHSDEERKRTKPDDQIIQAASSAPMPWLEQPAELWQRDFSGSPRAAEFTSTEAKEEALRVGTKARVYDLFDRWTFPEAVTAGRGYHYADITGECLESIELDFALTAQQWRDATVRTSYYRSVDSLIDTIGQTLLSDFGDRLEDRERELFVRALKTLAWQESKWQHYLRVGDRFFVLLSGGSYNQLDDWGITQMARSSFDPHHLLNANFFDSQGYCSISSSLYYGFMEYYFCYLEAREHPDNGSSMFNRLVGAYNRYSSGYSASCFALADDRGYRSYQIQAMGGFKDRFISQPWLEAMNTER